MKILTANKKAIQDIELSLPFAEQDRAKSELFSKIITPTNVVTFTEYPTIEGTLDGKPLSVPIWFNTTLKSANVRLGFDRLDSSRPGAIPLSDAPVHAMFGGVTGSGKSVGINDIICTMLLEYPPWELELYLADFKIVELSRYANRIPTPHVKLVAATESTEFALSVFKALNNEMIARQNAFTAMGVTNIKDFRKKYNLVLPRVVFLADEFVQMFENINTSREQGNDNADEQKAQIKAAISSTARLGRSSGVHMLLSSQNMDGVLDDQTSGQFAAGACLTATASVSNTLLGNPAGTKLTGKGKCYVNLNKTSKSEADNILVRVPFINAEPSESGELTYFQKLLSDIYELAKSFGWTRKPHFYNENDPVPFQLYEQHLAECKHRLAEPCTGNPDEDKIFKESHFALIPLGPPISYGGPETFELPFARVKNNNLLIHADDNLTKLYICQLVLRGLAAYNPRLMISVGDNVLFQQINFSKYCNISSVDNTGTTATEARNILSIRSRLMDLQNIFNDKNNGLWSDSLAVELIFNENMKSFRRKEVASSTFAAFMAEHSFSPNSKQLAEFCRLHNIVENTDVSIALVSTVQAFKNFKKTYDNLANGSRTITAGVFEPIVCFWVGADQLTDLQNSDVYMHVVHYLETCCQCNIYNVLVPSLECSKITRFTSNCNFILEACSKNFFFDVGLPRNININKNSFQVHTVNLKEHTPVRFYT